MKRKIIEIISAEYLNEYKIKISFKDDTEQIVDFKTFITKSGHPSIKEYLDLKKFKAFKIENGQLMWGYYDLIFPITDLYLGKISALNTKRSAV